MQRPKQRALPPLAFTRAEWPNVTGLPLKTADELVATGAIRSMKCGRRRMFLLRDVERWLQKLAKSGTNPEPRERYLAHRRALRDGAA